MSAIQYEQSRVARLGLCTVASLLAVTSLFVVVARAESLSLDNRTLFNEANQAYSRNDFGAAAEKYQRIIDSGEKSGEVLYNLGNCHFRMGRVGMAKLYYERARKFMPRDHNVLGNIALAESRTVDKISPGKIAAVAQKLCVWHFRLTGREISVIFLAAAAAFWVCLGILVFVRKRFVKTAIALAALLLVLSGSSYALKEIERRGLGSAVVIADQAQVRTGPGNYAITFNLHEGAQLKLVESRDGWYQIHLADGKRGWIEQDKLERI